MFRIFEYECQGIDCPEHFKVVERFVENDALQECLICHKEMHKVLSATRGYVPGSRNPCRQ